MGIPRVDGVGAGVGQPNRIDLNAERPQAALPVEVPKTGVNPPKRHRPGRPEEQTETLPGWSLADEAYEDHEASVERRSRWAGFKGTKGRAGWSPNGDETAPFQIARDRTAAQYGPAAFSPPPQQLGEPALNYFMRFSAALNEYYRSHGERVGVSAYGLGPGNETSAVLRRTRFRRRFALE